MAVSARGTGFQMTVTHKGHRVRKTFPTHLEALTAELQTKQAMIDGKPIPQYGNGTVQGTWTLGEAYSKVWAIQWSDSAYPLWQGRHRDKVLSYFGTNSSVKDITTAKVSEFTIMLKTQGLANSTINHTLQSLRKVMRFCDQNDKLDRMPVIKSLKISNARNRYLTKEECKLLKDACSSNQDLQDSVVLSLLTGVRVSELWRIKFRHFNEGFLYIEKSKNGDPRSIPVHSQVQGIINRRFSNPDDFVFHDTNVVREPWDKVRETLGWDDVVWHTLRHTFASLLAQGGTDMTVIMGLMGHRNLATTMRYAKLAPKNYREAITTLDV